MLCCAIQFYSVPFQFSSAQFNSILTLLYSIRSIRSYPILFYSILLYSIQVNSMSLSSHLISFHLIFFDFILFPKQFTLGFFLRKKKVGCDMLWPRPGACPPCVPCAHLYLCFGWCVLQRSMCSPHVRLC